MGPISTKIWNAFGWTSVGFVVLSVPLSLIDGVLTGLALYAAIILGGISSIGLQSTAKFGIATIAVSLLIGIIAAHYTSSTGFRSPELALIWAGMTIFAVPILASVVLMITGLLRRRHADRIAHAG